MSYIPYALGLIYVMLGMGIVACRVYEAHEAGRVLTLREVIEAWALWPKYVRRYW